MATIAKSDLKTWLLNTLNSEGVPNDKQPSDTEVDQIMEDGLREYSSYRPRQAVEDVTSDGSNKYALATTLDSYTDEFSRVLEIESPIEEDLDDFGEINVLTRDQWREYRRPDGMYIRFISGQVPASGENFRVTYTALRAFNSSDQVTVTDGDKYALVDLMASIGFRLVAGKFARTTNRTTVRADSTDHEDVSRRMLNLAKEYMAKFETHIQRVVPRRFTAHRIKRA